MSRKLLYYFLSPNDQNRIHEASATKPIQVSSGFPRYPDSLKITFYIKDPEKGPPKLLPLFPGSMRFIASTDPDVQGIVPPLNHTFQWTDAEYNGLKSIGTLIVGSIEEKKISKMLSELLGYPSLTPKKFWYWPVSLSKDFLFTTVKSNSILRTADIPKEGGGKTIKTHADWPHRAVANFLNGRYRPTLKQHNSDLSQDSIQGNLPTMVMGNDGFVELWIGAAYTSVVAEDPPNAINLDDGQINLLSVSDGLTPDDVLHPINAPLNVWYLMQKLKGEMTYSDHISPDTSQLNGLSKKLFAIGESGPRFCSIHFTYLGGTTLPFTCGELSRQKIKIFDNDNSLLQERSIPVNGRIIVTKNPPEDPTTIPIFDEVRVKFQPPINLRVTERSANVGYSNVDDVYTSLYIDSDELGRITLQPERPPAAGSQSEKTAYSKKLGNVVFQLSRHQYTRGIVKQTLSDYEEQVRPAGWPPTGLPAPSSGNNNEVLRGTRKPWTRVSRFELLSLFEALQKITISGGGDVPYVRPGEAMCLWLMEGKLSLKRLLISPSGKGFKPEFEVVNADFLGITQAELDAGTSNQIKDLFRAHSFFNFWGLDVYNNIGAGDDNPPAMSGPLATVVSNHNGKLTVALSRLDSVNISHPTLADLRATIRTKKVAGHWRVKATKNYEQTFIRLQFAEYLRRAIKIVPHLEGTILLQSPKDVWKQPGFLYFAYNSGIAIPAGSDSINITKTMFKSWKEITEKINDGTCNAKDQQSGLRCEKLTSGEVARIATRVARGQFAVRFVPRLNAIHFSALIESYGMVFPREI